MFRLRGEIWHFVLESPRFDVHGESAWWARAVEGIDGDSKICSTPTTIDKCNSEVTGFVREDFSEFESPVHWWIVYWTNAVNYSR